LAARRLLRVSSSQPETILCVGCTSQQAVPFRSPFRQRTTALAHAVSDIPNQAEQPTLPNLLDGEDRRRETEKICFPFDGICSSKRLFLKAAWTLRRQGIILITGVLSANHLERFQGKINLLLDAITNHETSGLEDIAYLNLPDQRVLKGYNSFVDADRAVINHRIKRDDGRSGSDAGMIDIFHPERLSDEIEELVATSLQEPVIRRLLMTSCLLPLHVKCRNLYINRGVQDTRSFHCDGRSLKYKSFLFLTEVDSLADGPYCYVKRSHRNRSSWKESRRFNLENEIGLYEYSQLGGCDALPMFAKAGDMVISSQRGAHRGLPQQPDAERAVLVNMYQR